jgi:ATP-dependent RNA helicase DDX31/DBP7
VRPSLRSLPIGAPSNAPIDTSSFAGLGLDPLLVHHLKTKMGISAPTAIQKSCLPYMLSSPLDADARREEDEDGNLLPVSDDARRDVFIQSQTGSGKTFAFLLPIIQALLPLSRLSYIDRSIGTLAIVLAPTRELAQQISKVLENILTLALSHSDDEEDRGFTRWLVGGLIVGGSTRTHDKARLRKGVPILVATPGRLLDHLQNTQSFQCAKTLYLVLDEADRLMDLGFEETILGITRALEGRRRNEIAAEKEQDAEGGGLMRWPYWNRGRQTILCSATIDAKVERLAGVALKDPVVFRSTDDDKVKTKAKTDQDAAVADALQASTAIAIPDAGEKFTPPAQLAQKYVVAPTKLRLVTLVALLRSLVGSAAKIAVDSDAKDGTKVIVFLSTTDAVDYHFKLLGGVTMGAPAPEPEVVAEDEDDDESGTESADDAEAGSDSKKSKAKAKKTKKTKPADDITLRSTILPNTTIQRLHGSLPLRTRQASLKAFATPCAHASILLATSVASRGLDLPLVKAVVQYDLPTEGGAAEYVHRVGRTARAGQGGEAWALVAPAEAAWVPWVESKMVAASGEDGSSVRLQQVGVDEVLRRGFGGRGHEFEARATDIQLAFERWVLADDAVSLQLYQKLNTDDAERRKRAQSLQLVRARLLDAPDRGAPVLRDKSPAPRPSRQGVRAPRGPRRHHGAAQDEQEGQERPLQQTQARRRLGLGRRRKTKGQGDHRAQRDGTPHVRGGAQAGPHDQERGHAGDSQQRRFPGHGWWRPGQDGGQEVERVLPLERVLSGTQGEAYHMALNRGRGLRLLQLRYSAYRCLRCLRCLLCLLCLLYLLHLLDRLGQPPT